MILACSQMFSINSQLGLEEGDTMIYSAGVLAIRYCNYKWIEEQLQFIVNRKGVPNSEQIMEERIIKIISLAAYKSSFDAVGSKNVLILGVLRYGVFKNNASMMASKFEKTLSEEKMRYHFDSVVFPIFNGIMQTFQTISCFLR